MTDELLVNLAADETEDFAPFVVVTMFIEQRQQIINCHLLRLSIEAADILGRGKVFEECAVDETVQAGTAEAQDVVAFTQLLNRARTIDLATEKTAWKASLGLRGLEALPVTLRA